MKYELISPIKQGYSVTEQILTNRGIKREDIPHFLNTTAADINSPLALGEEKLRAAAQTLIKAIQENQRIFVVCDCDCDGYTSSAIFINYLHDLFPTWVETKLEYGLHENKEHGLSDQIDYLENENYSVVVIPDAGTNDVEYCQRLFDKGTAAIILDHHIQDEPNPYAIVINSQNDYPNKELSGAGVTWQFCRYLDSLLDTSYASDYVDLACLGDCGDMMNTKSLETKEIIREGIENIKNPFFYYMVEKNSYSIGSTITPTSLSFYIVPFINAIVRSGTLEEKQLVFSSMLKYKAFKEVPSTKRGHSFGDTEKIVEQAVRVATNVKARQTKVQNNMMSTFEQMIKDQNLLDHKVLLFLMEPGQIDRNVAGLCANKIMSKYQRPTCILTKVTKDNEVSFQGSARGCDRVGVNLFKELCESTNTIMYAAGHSGAFGVGIESEKINDFLKATDLALVNMSDEAIYQVDFIYEGVNFNPDDILEIANLAPVYGQGVHESEIAVEHLKITPDMVTVYNKRTITIKIVLSNGVSIMIFNATDNDVSRLQEMNSGYIEVNVVATCQANEWNGNVSPQLLCKEYQIIDSSKYFF